MIYPFLTTSASRRFVHRHFNGVGPGGMTLEYNDEADNKSFNSHDLWEIHIFKLVGILRQNACK